MICIHRETRENTPEVSRQAWCSRTDHDIELGQSWIVVTEKQEAMLTMLAKERSQIATHAADTLLYIMVSAVDAQRGGSSSA